MSNLSDNILIRGVNWLGDAVMSTPALLRLREARPRARIVLLTPAKLAGLWARHPAIDQTMTFAAGEGVLSVARRLRRERFSTALILPNSPRSALEVFLAGIPERVGTGRPWRGWLLNRRVKPRAGEVPMLKRTPAEIRKLTGRASARAGDAIPPRAHHIFQYLHLAEALGANPAAATPLVVVGSDEADAIRARFGAGSGATRQPGAVRCLIGINPGAEYGPAKRWPAERFAAAAVGVARARKWDFDIWVLGGPGDRELANLVCSGIRAGIPEFARDRVRNLAGETSLRELCAALKACDVLLTNDTGPMHVAAAVGTPVVVPFGSTSWRMTGPGLPGDPRHRFIEAGAPCSPCYRRTCPIDFRCMTGVAVETVIREVEIVLKAGKAGNAETQCLQWPAP